MVIVDRRERRCDSKYQTNELTGRHASFVALSKDSQGNCSVNRTISGQSVVIRNESQQEKSLISFSLMVIVAAPAGLSGQISEWSQARACRICLRFERIPVSQSRFLSIPADVSTALASGGATF